MNVQEKFALGAAGLVVLLMVGGMMATNTAPGPSPEVAHSDAGSPLIETVSTGEEIDLDQILKEGQQTLIEFTGDW
jgi:hypothetical protein